MDWDDLRAFIAVAQHGSLRQAAETLGVTQPTIARRLRLLEADLGIPLFERDRDGHRLTAEGAALLPDARSVETAALRVEQRSLGLLGRLAETVRVGAGEWAAAVLARGLSGIADGPQIELVVTGALSPTASRAPDILIRHGLPESGGGLTRRVGSLGCAVYGAGIFADGRALPLAPSEVTTLPWLGFVEEQEHYVTMRWLRAQMRERPPAARLMNTDLMVVAANSGIGVAVLPCFIGIRQRAWSGCRLRSRRYARTTGRSRIRTCREIRRCARLPPGSPSASGWWSEKRIKPGRVRG